MIKRKYTILKSITFFLVGYTTSRLHRSLGQCETSLNIFSNCLFPGQLLTWIDLKLWICSINLLARVSRWCVCVFLKVIYGLVSVDPSIIPKARITRPTLLSSSGVIKFVEPKCHADRNLSKVLYRQMHTRLERCC